MSELEVVPQPDGRALSPLEESPAPARRRPRWPGWIALALGILTLLGHGVAQYLVAAGDFPLATLVAAGAAVAGALATIAGLVAAIALWGRGAGIAGLALGLLANPVVLSHGLSALEGAS